MVRNPPANEGDVEDVGAVPGLGRSPRGGNGNPLQYFFLENPTDRGTWQAIVKGVKELDTPEQLSIYAHTSTSYTYSHLKTSEHMLTLLVHFTMKNFLAPVKSPINFGETNSENISC